MPTARDCVWIAVIRLTSEQAGFSNDDVSSVCEEMFGEEAPDRELIDDTIGVMCECDVLEPFNIESEKSYYVLGTDIGNA